MQSTCLLRTPGEAGNSPGTVSEDPRILGSPNLKSVMAVDCSSTPEDFTL